MNLFRLRKKKINARPKAISALVVVLISGLLVSIPVSANAAACVPTETTDGTDTVLTFSTVGSCDWNAPGGITSVRVLVVGGGSSGGAGQTGVWWPQGGGGGAVVEQSNVSVTSTIAITVGGGGAAIPVQSTPSTSANNGGQSSFATLTANGGTAPVNTLARGGSSGNGNLGGATSGGNSSGGGGGAGTVGSGTTGGVGVNSTISGSTVMYGSGGAGANSSSGTASSGGGSNASAPIANRGGGGSQPSAGTGQASAGGSGVVIVRYGIPNGSSLLSFNVNGGTGSDASKFMTTGTAGVIPSSTNISRAGFDFVGWNTLANGSGDLYALGDPITISANTILYAKWIRIPGPSCATGVGKGGVQAATLALSKGGDGCVGITYKLANGTYTPVTFNYTGADQPWTSPAGATSLTFFLIGAGGGSSVITGNGPGGSAGFTIGTYAVSAPTTFKVIVGRGGFSLGNVSTYGGGGGGGGAEGGYGSGGGRSAIRLGTGTTDLITAGGGGGGGYNNYCGGGGGGDVGGDGGARKSTDGGGGSPITGGCGGVFFF